ncbi:DUF7674 family protein [Nocardiopsis ganjiahuensis]
MDGGLQLVIDLVCEFPSLEDAYESHLFNEGEVLPHVFFWDVTNEVIDSFLADEPHALEWSSLLDFLELKFRNGESGVRSVIGTSFLWYLPHPGAPGCEIVNFLGFSMALKFRDIRPQG